MYSINQNGLSHDDVIFKVEAEVEAEKLPIPNGQPPKNNIVLPVCFCNLIKLFVFSFYLF